VACEEHEVDDDRQHEVRRRSCEHDHEALPQRAAREATPDVAALPGLGLGRGLALTLDPEDADVPADREHADLVLGLAQRDPKHRPAVADREPQDLHVQELRSHEVAKLVDHHEHADEQEEIEDRQTAADGYIRNCYSLGTWRRSPPRASPKRRG
jgi:hypothetical protein